jgi:Uma2 family endonuclease
MASLPSTPLSEEEYLTLERAAEYKSEFHDGQMFAMSGGTLNHALLTANAIAVLRGAMPSGCRTFSSDLRIKVPQARLYTYPDCSVVCGEPQLFSEHKDNVLNPVLIVEVLSPSTEAYDRGKKFEMYRTMESFKEYLLIHQDRRLVEHYSKQDDGSWVLREHAGDGAVIRMGRLNATLPLAELYASALNLPEADA